VLGLSVNGDCSDSFLFFYEHAAFLFGRASHKHPSVFCFAASVVVTIVLFSPTD
jgi:hypothetical protein